MEDIAFDIAADENARERRMRAVNYKNLFSTDTGKKVLEDMKKFMYYNHSVHYPGDSYETAFRDGMRTAILRILRLIDVADSPDMQESYGTGVEEGKSE